jgi:ABC-type enterobactin transport system permease subunit
MLNILTVVSNGGIDLGAGVIRIVVTQMVHGALGALLGYFLGRDKFDKERVWWMSVGVVLAAVLYGLYSWLSGEITQAGISLSNNINGYNPWPSLILGTVFAIVVLGAVFTLVNRDLRADMGLPPTVATTTSTTTTTTTTSTP